MSGGTRAPPNPSSTASARVVERCVPRLQRGDVCLAHDLGLRAVRVTPGSRIAGFQPAGHEAAREGGQDRGREPGSRMAGFQPAGQRPLAGLKARNVKAWADGSPASGGPGHRRPQTFPAL